MLLGRVPYGGPHYPRQVTAGGSVVAGCTAQVAEYALRPASGQTVCTSHALGEGVRVVIPVPKQGAAKADVSGFERAHYAAFGSVSGDSTAYSQARVDFAAFGEAIPAAAASGENLRVVRMRWASQAHGYANPEGDADIYVWGFGETARATAFTFGSHFFVGSGNAQPSALVAAEAQHIRHSGGCSETAATGIATAQVESSSGSGQCVAEALLDSDPILEIGGVTHWFARGEAVAEVELGVKPYIYTVMLGVGRALVSGDAQTRQAGAGRAVARATGQGDMERVLPFEGTVIVGAVAEGSVAATIAAFGAARTDGVAAAGTAQSVFHAEGGAIVNSGSAAELLRLAIATRPGTAGGFSSASGATRADRLGDGATSVTAAARGAARAHFQGTGWVTTNAGPLAALADHPKLPVSGQAQALGNAVSLEERLAHRAYGAALAEAVPEGWNLVDGGDQRLGGRVMWVGSEARTARVGSTQRAIFVDGVSRQLAA